MKTINRLSISVFILILILCLSLTNASPALADEGQPDQPPIATEEPIEEGQPTEPLPTNETNSPTEEALDEVLAQLPEGTDVVVLDAEGEVVPLASQTAAEIVVVGDPMWCPAGTLPGGSNCTTNYPSIDLLVDEMTGTNKPNYMQDGIIYFTSGSSGGSFIMTNGGIGPTDFDSLNDYNLILQGGWNGLDLGFADFSGQTDFGSNYIEIGTNGNRWIGNVTLNNFSFSGVGSSPSNSNAVTIYTTTGSITLSNVDVTNQTNNTYTAILDSTSGNINVDDSSFDGDTSDQSKGFVAVTGGAITISDSVFQGSRRGKDNTYKGADLTAPTVSLTNVTATDNDGNGIDISSANTVTLNNVIATFNGTDPAAGANIGSGLRIFGTGATIVNLTGGTFSNNFRYGVEVSGSTIYQLSAPTCSGNVLASVSNPCYNVTAIIPNTAPTLNLPGDMTVEATSASGAVVTFTASATDTEDNPDPTPSCSPASGSTFAIGTSTVDCSVTDSGSLTTDGSFNVTVTTTSSGGTTNIVGGATGGATFTNLFIPITGGNTFALTCTAPEAFKIESHGHQIVFNNLCGYNASVEGVEQSALPGNLPPGTSLLGGFTINILKDGELVDPLPASSGLSIGFKIPADRENEDFAVYEWNGEEWVEVQAEKTADGFFSVNVSEGGTFIFVQE